MSKTILLVDDSKTERVIVTSLLEEKGFDVHIAENGREGLEKIVNDQSLFDLVILDIIMPEMDGFTMLKELRRKEIAVPVILLTKQKEEYMKDLLYFEKYSYYLEKPFKPEDLLEKMNKIFKEHE